MPSFGTASLKKLATLDPRLQAILNEVIKYIDFTIVCGYRDKAGQDAAIAAGTSKTPWPNSKHNHQPSLAVDIAPWPIDWQDTERFILLAGATLLAAAQLGISIRWGGIFTKLRDLPHFELI